nr:YpmS family protein [Lysinibacillus timonensis]
MNKWKVAFFLLVSAIVIFTTTIVIMALSPTEDAPLPEVKKAEGSVLLVETTTKDFEKLALKYLGDALNTESLPIAITVNDQIQIFSEVIAFGVSVPVQIDFEPVVNESGNIHLKYSKIHVGMLNIPPSTVLKLLEETIELPAWVVIRPNAEEIFVDLSQLTVAEGSSVRAKEIDLKNDRILLEVIVPNE